VNGGATVIALISAYNEADIIDHVLSHLEDHGIASYVLDDGSTDATRAIVDRHAGRGVIGVETLAHPESPREFNWTRILERKQALAMELDAAWFIHHDADEFRESPWPDRTLAEAIARVDAEGYNAVDFALFDFHPTDATSEGSDPRTAITFYEDGPPWNRQQVKCWKKTDAAVDLIASGGHDATFPGRRVYPLRFLLRHYPIRSAQHGARKIFAERIPGFRVEERQRGWHVQYDRTTAATFIRDPAALTRFDPAVARASTATADALALDRDRRDLDATARQLRQELSAAQDREAMLSRRLHESGETIRRVEQDVARLNSELSAQHQQLAAELVEIYRSRTWRWTRIVRALFERLSGQPRALRDR
jgi:hypothetical protein